MDSAGQLLVDLQDLADAAVLSVGRLRADVLELQAVLVDPLVGGAQGGDELLGADQKMTLAAPQAYEANWLPDAEAMTSVPSRVTACTLPRA